MAASFKRVIYVLVPILAYYVVHDLTRLIMMFALQQLAGRSRPAYDFITSHDALVSGLISIVDILAGMCVLLFIMKTDPEELSFWDYVNLNSLSFYRLDRIHSPAFSWILLLIQAVCTALGINILIRLSGIIRYSSYGETASAQFALPLWLGILLYGFVSPLAEELLFRLIVFGRLKRRFNIYIAGVMNALFFGLYHRNIVQGIYGFVMGLLMCLACEYVHSIFGSLMIHCVANLTIYFFGLYGILTRMEQPAVCAVFTAVGALTVFIEVFYSYRSMRLYGDIEGVTFVGGFYVDPAYGSEDDTEGNAD